MRNADRVRLLSEIGRRLLRRFGARKFTLREEPVGSLVWTVLSQNTTDLTAERAYRQLRGEFRSWPEVLAAPRSRVEAAIRVCGLHQQKARTIQGFLRRVQDERGRLSLSFLKRMSSAEALEWLTASPGIGTKTAAVVLLFAFGMPLFPVDTHIRRVSGRLGLVPEGTPAHRVQELLSGCTPDSAAAAAQLHLDMIRLGRELCLARGPRCGECPLAGICRHARRGRAALGD